MSDNTDYSKFTLNDYTLFARKILRKKFPKVRITDELITNMVYNMCKAQQTYDPTKSKNSTWIMANAIFAIRTSINKIKKEKLREKKNLLKRVTFKDSSSTYHTVVDEVNLSKQEVKILIQDSLSILRPNERKVIELHYLQNNKITDISNEFKVSTKRIYYILNNALKKMRKYNETNSKFKL